MANQINQVTVSDTIQTNKPKFAFIPVRTIRDYQDADFIAVSEYFHNAPFTYKFLGLDYQAYRKRAQSLGCYYPTTIKKNNTKIPNPDFNHAIPELKWILSPFSVKKDSYVIDISEADKLIEKLRNSKDFENIYKADKLVSPKDKADVLANIDEALNAKFAMMEGRICQKIEEILGFKATVDNPLFKAYLEYQEGTSETFQDFCKYKLLGPVSEAEIGDRHARRIGYPTHEEFKSLMANYGSYNQIAKFKNVSSSVVAKWAAYWDMASEHAMKIENRM